MKVLVTGAAGFIGSHLSERLVGMGHEVIGLDALLENYALELKELNITDITQKGVKFLKLNLAEDDLSSLSAVDVIYHLAAQPGISTKFPFENYLINNIVATHNLLKSQKENKNLKILVNIATSSVYGARATDDELAAPKPTSYYGVCKLAAEQLALSYFRDKNMPVCSVRPFSVYGERERPEKLYPKLIGSILNDEEFPLREGSDKHVRSYTYVGDIVDGLLAIMENKDKCKGEIFNIGSDKTITTGEGMQIVEQIIGKKANIKVVPRWAGDQFETSANIEKARRVLGYNPTTTPYEGLKKEVEWYKEKVWKKIN